MNYIFPRWICSILLLVLLSSFVFASDWFQVPLKNDFSNSFSDLCFYQDQCLVNHKGSIPFDNQPDKWYSAKKDKDEPRCINSDQYILDYYCDRGDWTSRTRIVSLELFGAASTAGQTRFDKNFTMICGQYNFVLNSLDYSNKFGNVKSFLNKNLNTQQASNKQWHPILNNVCVIDFDNHVILGVSLNSVINETDSFLKALNRDVSVCDPISNTTALGSTQYVGCSGAGTKVVGSKTHYELYYDSSTNTLIYDPDMVLVPYPIYTLLQFYPNVIEPEFVDPILSYTQNSAHNSSASITGKNFSLFNNPKLYNNIYLTVKGNTSIFSFIEEDQTDNHLDYLGFISKNINYPGVTCNIIVNSDSQAVTYCQNNVAPNYFVVSKKPSYLTPKLMELWKGLTSLLKIK